MKRKKNANSLGSFLQSLDLKALGFSKELIQDVSQVEKTFEALGFIKQKLIEQDEQQLLCKFDRFVEKEIKRFPKENTIFPNRLPDKSFGISTVISDPHSKILDMSPEEMKEYYKTGRVIRISVGKKEVVFGHKEIDPNCFMGPFPEFLEIMTKWHDPRIIQHWCCCWNWACQNQSFYFPYVPINEILATVYTPSSKGKFCQRVRQAFSASLRFFHNATIELPVAVETRNKKGKKRIEQATRIFRLFNLDLAKKNKKGDVYLKIAGQLLSGLNPGKFRGRVFPKGIFALNANREGSRILLAYRICNRLDQLAGKPLEWTIDSFINSAGLTASYEQDHSAAYHKLKRSLKRLVEVGCIEDFDPKKLSTRIDKSIKIYPSKG